MAVWRAYHGERGARTRTPCGFARASKGIDQPMKLTAAVTKENGRYFAQCNEVDRAGEGATAEEALANLRLALLEYFRESEAVAPPTHEDHEAIEITVTSIEK